MESTQVLNLQNNLYFNAWEVVNTTSFFVYIFIGGRGIGKTFSMLRGLVQSGSKFMYVRREGTELDNCCNEKTNPFISINNHFGTNITITKQDDSYTIWNENEYIGIAGALSTFGKLRGASYDDIDYIFIDEFICTSPVDRLYKVEFELFSNMIETVNRNREIEGKESIKVILCANSNRLKSGILQGLEIGETIRQMKINDIETFTDINRSIYLCLPKDLPITRKKKETALYKLTAGTKFYDMAIDNNFNDIDFNNIKVLKRNQLKPLVSFDNLTFYTIKGQDKLYVDNVHVKESVHYTEDEKKEFMRFYGINLSFLLRSGNIICNSLDTKMTAFNILK